MKYIQTQKLSLQNQRLEKLGQIALYNYNLKELVSVVSSKYDAASLETR